MEELRGFDAYEGQIILGFGIFYLYFFDEFTILRQSS